ncbi:phytoene/squalene synthase family protein [Erythrobacteraceae bacterium CFH 75059]|uniref:phytoene/squalene synthase family protein n=1 Tax=Qipengyuania thermophila TaxID=2509361 RepID=UPI0010229C91|nr:phytoene/squalene synthase family protein [Qipengyuania thermophila]TCD04844.1 phytoene/squalene synthase family protein [Erythrobacteraceae bacterium CFH 75059]
MLAPSRVLIETPARAGGGNDRAELVWKAREAIAKGSRSFALASRLLDRNTRERVWLLYAWCRRCDDIADDQHLGGRMGESKAAEDKVQAIRVLTRRAFDGLPTADPAFDGFGMVAAEAGITRDMADDVIGGFALDATGWQPRSEGDMMRYCYHVAGAVGVMMAKVMGVPGEDFDTYDRACDLGLAFQIANIARDVVEDAAAGRCYLPQEWLAEKDLAPGAHARPENRFVLASIMPRLIGMMDTHVAAARLGAARLPFRQRWAILAAARIYAAIGHEVLARGQNAWDERVVIGKAAKLRHVAAAFREAVVNRPVAPHPMPVWTRSKLQPVKGW